MMSLLKWSGIIALTIGATLLSYTVNSQVAARYDVCPQGCAFQSIQASVDASRDNGLILIGPGSYHESLRITKSVTLWGAGSAVVLIQPTPSSEAFSIESKGDQRIRVNISQLSIQASFGFHVKGSVDATIQGVRFSPTKDLAIAGYGVEVDGTSIVTLLDTTFTGATNGILAREFSQLFLVNVEITKNFFGIELRDSAQAVIFESLITETSFVGIGSGGGSARVSINGSKILKSEVGIAVNGQARFTIIDSIVSENRRSGIEISGSGQLILSHTTVSSNGSKNGPFGGGVIIGLPNGNPSIVIEGSQFISNIGWGIAILIHECFPDLPNLPEKFLGQVSGSKNQIPDKNELQANQLGDVCPIVLKFLKTEQGGRYTGP